MNQREWENPARWFPRRVRNLYTSHSDTRLMVPKARPGFGWTFNFGHRYDCIAVIGIFVIGLAVGFALEAVL